MESKHFWEYSSTLSLMLNNEFPDCISMQAHSLCWRFLFPLYPNKVILPICAKHQFILVKIALDLVSRVFKFSGIFLYMLFIKENSPDSYNSFIQKKVNKKDWLIFKKDDFKFC